MAMLTIDGIEIPTPEDLTVNFQTIETVQQSEAGTDLITVTRLKKRTISFTAKCNSKMFYDYYDPNGSLYVGAGLKMVCFPGDSAEDTHLARVRIRSAKFIQNSDTVDSWRTMRGLWEVGLEIIEV